MKLLSLWEPWATLMAIGAKRIETRDWRSSYLGWLAIHASKGGLNKLEMQDIMCDPAFPFALRGHSLSFGKIVAVVQLTACVSTEKLVVERAYSDLITDQEKNFGNYAPGRFGWITSQLFRLPEPLPFKAKQGLVEVPEEIVQEIRKQWPKRV